MRVNEKGKFVRNVRYESQRFRVILIVMGCFLISLTFMLSSRQDEVPVGNASFDLSMDESPASPRITSKVPRKFGDNDPHVSPAREDSHFEHSKPRDEESKQSIDSETVGVDLISDMSHGREDLESENSQIDTKPAHDTITRGDLESRLGRRGEFEPKNDGDQSDTDTDTVNLRDVGENNEFEKTRDHDPNENIDIDSTLIDHTNEEKTKFESDHSGDDENEDKIDEDDEPKQEKIPTLLDRFNENTESNIIPKTEVRSDGDESKQDKVPTLLDRFNENTIFNIRPKDSDQSDSVEKGEIMHVADKTEEDEKPDIAREIPNANLNCDYSDFRSDTCNLNGDVRIHANSASIYFGDPTGLMNQSYILKPYPRKGDEMAFQRVVAFNVISKKELPKCTKSYDVPGVVFSIGGYTGNIFHDFSDVIMPLFTAIRSLNGEVQLVMTNTQDWWLIKYDKIIKSLSNYTPIRLDDDKEVHCFESLTVGLVAHKELIIEPSRNPNHYTTQDFTQFIRDIFPLERDSPTHLGETNKKPRMLIISRARSRMITNLKEVVSLGQELGFEVMVQETDVGNDLVTFAQLINSCDVMLGVHGAGLTNEMFLPPKGTLIQIIPWGGLEWIGQMDYGEPATNMGLNYIQYSIKVEESSFIEKYPRDHELFKNPIELHKKGFVFIHEVLMNGQNVTLNLKRFRNVLIVALDKLTY